MKTSDSREAYVFKMKLLPANVASFAIFAVLVALTLVLGLPIFPYEVNPAIVFILIILYLILHELLHGLGYLIGGTKRSNIIYGMALEKGILYAMANQELTKKNILISLQMPFTVIGVITYIIGAIIKSPLLIFLSIINLMGAIMDIVMFIYISRLNKNTTYSESGEPDEFVLITSDKLEDRKNLFFKIIKTKKYKESDYIFEKQKRVRITKFSVILLLIFIGLGIILSII